MQEIKCPFCGSNETLFSAEQIGCESCGAEGPFHYPALNKEATVKSFENPQFILSAKEKELAESETGVNVLQLERLLLEKELAEAKAYLKGKA